MRIEHELKFGFEDVLIRPKRSTLTSRKDVNLFRKFTFCHSSSNIWTGIPIMVSNMDTTGTFEMAKSLSSYGILTCIHKHYSIEEWTHFLCSFTGDLSNIIVTIGSKVSDLNKLSDIMRIAPTISIICIDVANGYTEQFTKFVRFVRKLYPHKIIIAGNVVTGEMTEELILSGADIVKVGIGPGSVCTTRLKTGVGYPQLSALIECADAAHGLGGHIISDGGCVIPGDFAKAFGGGADFVMAGGIFAGHDESGGKLTKKNGKYYKTFYGMSSAHAMLKYSAEIPSYRASEGKIVEVPYKGNVKNTIEDILGGLRSCCTYVGASTIKELPKRTTFIRTNKQVNNCFS